MKNKKIFLWMSILFIFASLVLTACADSVAQAKELETIGLAPPVKEMQLNLSHIECVDESVEVHFVLLNVPGVTPAEYVNFTSNGNAYQAARGANTGNAWHYYYHGPDGYYDVTEATVEANGETVVLHNDGDYTGNYNCGSDLCEDPTIEYGEWSVWEETSPNHRERSRTIYYVGEDDEDCGSDVETEEEVYICYGGESFWVNVEDLDQYEGYYEGECSDLCENPTTEYGKWSPWKNTNDPNRQMRTRTIRYVGEEGADCGSKTETQYRVFICYGGENFWVLEKDLSQYPGYTVGACGGTSTKNPKLTDVTPRSLCTGQTCKEFFKEYGCAFDQSWTEIELNIQGSSRIISAWITLRGTGGAVTTPITLNDSGKLVLNKYNGGLNKRVYGEFNGAAFGIVGNANLQVCVQFPDGSVSCMEFNDVKICDTLACKAGE